MLTGLPASVPSSAWGTRKSLCEAGSRKQRDRLTNEGTLDEEGTLKRKDKDVGSGKWQLREVGTYILKGPPISTYTAAVE